MKTVGIALSLLISALAFANQPLDCAPAAALKIHGAMQSMGASSYAPGRYAFLRSTCGVAEQGLYCLGRDYENRVHEPIRQRLARDYQQGLPSAGFPETPPREDGRRGKYAAGEAPRRRAESFLRRRCQRAGHGSPRRDHRGNRTSPNAAGGSKSTSDVMMIT